MEKEQICFLKSFWRYQESHDKIDFESEEVGGSTSKNLTRAYKPMIIKSKLSDICKIVFFFLFRIHVI